MSKPNFTKSNLDENPSIIDIDMLEQWLDSREGKIGDYRISGKKYLLNSIWKADFKRHLAILPQRGEYGRYRCFKSGKNGSVIDFIMEVDGIGFGPACRLVSGTSFSSRKSGEKSEKKQAEKTSLSKVSWDIQIPDGCVLMERKHLDGSGALYNAARYLYERKIDPKRVECYYCTKDRTMPDGRWQKLSHRILFPYRDENGQLYYWTARAINPWQEPRYLEPHMDDGGAPKEKVLYVPDWDIKDRVVPVIEGPIDAISLNAAKMPVVAVQGSTFYKEQMDILKTMGIIPVWGFDPDLPGMKATVNAWEKWGGESYFVFAPQGTDWNKMLVDGGKEAVKQHIVNNIKALDERIIFHLRSQISCLEPKITTKTARRKTAPPKSLL